MMQVSLLLQEGIMGASATPSGRQHSLPQTPFAQIPDIQTPKSPGMLHVHGLPMSPAPPPRPKKQKTKKRLFPGKKGRLQEGKENLFLHDAASFPADASVSNSSTAMGTSTDGWTSDEDDGHGLVEWGQEQDALLWACLEELRVKGNQ